MNHSSAPPRSPAPDEQIVISLRDVRVVTAAGADIVDELSLQLSASEILGLVGESGCGKTTVGMALLGHCRRGSHLEAGRIEVAGVEVTERDLMRLRSIRGRVVSYIPQDPASALNPALRIGLQLRGVLDAHMVEWNDEQREDRLREVLREVALPSDDSFLRRYPHQLSGGQQQRVVIAMAVACRPRVVVCDEPTTGLDVTTQARVLSLVRDLCRAHRIAVLYISHDLAVVASLADQVAVMYAGRIVERGTRQQLFASPRHPYTRRLLDAVPDIEGRRQLRGIPGHAPGPGQRPRGCSFAPRCPFADEQCRAVFPPEGEVAPGHTLRCYHPETAPQVSPAERTTAAATADDVVLEIRGLEAGYGGSSVLHDVNLQVRRHECLALVGESGSGKTTIARCVAGLHPRHTGTITLQGLPLAQTARERSHEQRKNLQYIFQSPYASLNPRHTVGESIAAPLRLFDHGGRLDRKARIAGLLERVSLPAAMARSFPDELSGGERQRVAIARALATRPAMLVCDEITSALDVSVQAAIIDLLRELRQEMGLSLLFITHNLALIRTVAERVAVIHSGAIIESGLTKDVFAAPAAAYTQSLLADTPNFSFAVASELPA